MSYDGNISVLFVEPFYGGSHKQLIDVLKTRKLLKTNRKHHFAVAVY